MHQVIIDPLALGDVATRRRIYILVIHRKILRKDITSNAALERVLQEMVEHLKVEVPAPDPYLGETIAFVDGSSGVIKCCVNFFPHDQAAAAVSHGP